jgi:hypothetical protein
MDKYICLSELAAFKIWVQRLPSKIVGFLQSLQCGLLIKAVPKPNQEEFQMRLNANRNLAVALGAILVLSLAVPVFAQGTNPPQTQGQDQTRPGTTATQDQTTTGTQTQQSPSATTAAGGQKMEVDGVILKRTGDNFTLLDERGKEIVVTLTNDTEVKEKKSNPFRRAKNYATTQLLRGLQVEVEGRGDGSGSITADKVKFKDDDLRVASSVESRVTPVEGRLDQAEGRLSQSEQNAQRLSGQVEELTTISNAARGGAKAAQETADQAVQAASQANAGVKTTNERISSLDDFDVKNSTIVNFKVGSSVLSKDAQATLDQIAAEAKTEKDSSWKSPASLPPTAAKISIVA